MAEQTVKVIEGEGGEEDRNIEGVRKHRSSTADNKRMGDMVLAGLFLLDR